MIFSEDIVVNTPLAGDFTVSGLHGSPVVSSVDHISENSIRIAFTGSVFSDTDSPIIMSYTKTSGYISDLADNELADFTNLEITNNLDTSRPIPVIALDPPETFTPTALSPISVTITFSEPVSVLVQSDVTVTGGIVLSLTETAPFDSTVYRAVITPSLTDGIISVMVLSDVITDPDFNGNVAATFDISVDSTGPTVRSAKTLSSTTIALRLSESVTLDAAVPPANFVISGTNVSLPPAQVTGVALLSETAGNVIILTLDATADISGTDALVVSYTNSAGSLSDASGNTLSDFDDFTIINNTPYPPDVSSVYATVPDGTYLTGDTVEIAVLFTKPVTVTAGTSGSPTLLLNVGPNNHTAAYSGTAGSSSNVLTFSYTVLAGVVSNDLQYTGTAALTLPPGSTITESGTDGTVDAIIILPDLSSDNSLASNSNIAIDGIPTQIISAEVRGQNSLQVSYNRPVTVTTDHYTDLVIGGTTRNILHVFGSGTTNTLVSFDGTPADLGVGGTVDINTHVVATGQAISARSQSTAFTDSNPVILIANDITDTLTVTDNITVTSITPALGLYPLGAGSTLALPPSVIKVSFDYDADDIDDVYITFAPDTVVSNLGPDGIIILSQSAKTVRSDAIPAGARLTNNIIVDLGDTTRDLLFDNPISIDLVNRSGETGFFIDAAGSTNTVLVCSINHADIAANTVAELVSAKVELRTRGINECSVSVGDDLRFYSFHLSAWGSFDNDDVPDVFPRNRNTGGGGAGGGGGSGGSTPPSFTTSFGRGADTIVINNIGISPTPFRSLHVQDTPITIPLDRSIPFSFTLYDDESWQSITHLELCLNKPKPNNIFCDGDTKVIWDKNNSSETPEITDPNNVIDTATVTVSKDSLHVATFDFEITFDGAVSTTDLQIRSWDAKNNMLEFTVENALVVTGQNESVYQDGARPVSNDNTLGDGGTKPALDNATTSCAPGKLLLDDQTCMDPKPGTFVCLSDQVMLSDNTCKDTATITSTTNDNRRLVISMWAGYHTDTATDAQLLDAFNIGHAITLPDWFRSDLGSWVAQDRVALQEFEAALQYLIDS